MGETTAFHRAIVVVDVAGFTDPARTMVHQAAVHDGLYAVLEAGFTDAGIDLEKCTVEDRGDGALVLVPPEIPKSALANHLSDGLLRALHRYNAVHSAEAAMKLRVALHAGEVKQDTMGAVSQAINFAFRILDAGPARLALQNGSSPLVMIASDPFFQEVIAQDPAAAPQEYKRIAVRVKKTVAEAWLRSPRLAGPTQHAEVVAQKPPRAARTVLRGQFSLSRTTIGLLAAFGLLSMVVVAVDLAFGSTLRTSWELTAAVVLVSVAGGLAYGRPRLSAHRAFKHPNTSLRVIVGDVFDQPDQLVVGFTDTFDTDTTDDLVISASAVQGQLLHRIYGGERSWLDRDLAEALSAHQPVTVESRSDKQLGKLERYPVGTVAVLRPANSRVFCCAYSVLGNDLVAQSTVDKLWQSLGSLWTTVAEHGRRAPLAMPIVGSELARIDMLDRESLLKLIMLSYIARSRESVFCKELTIVVHPKDLAEINMTQVAAFLRRL